ncbi:MAG: stage V sporulation protein AA [Agathobacter sp.]|nr:stage V sporulation protein AA [Agathobacter sp.]MBQ6812046.1 stage V sporulation protein AA [Agathobacter sp.]
MQICVYIKANGNCIVYDKNITLGDVLKIECTDLGMLRVIKQMDLYGFNHEHSVVFSVLKVVERIHRDYPQVEVINCGESDFVVEYQKSTVKSPVLEKLKLWGIAVIVFFGSAFTIMAFHIDISIQKVFEKFYEQVMGVSKPQITELEISYSIGLAVGIVVFFNHFRKRKLTNDPTPIEVEMKKYNEDLINAKIAESDEKGHTIDVS